MYTVQKVALYSSQKRKNNATMTTVAIVVDAKTYLYVFNKI